MDPCKSCAKTFFFYYCAIDVSTLTNPTTEQIYFVITKMIGQTVVSAPLFLEMFCQRQEAIS